jgi:hypothetical protein
VTEPAFPIDAPDDDTCFTRVAYGTMLDTALAGGYGFLGYHEALTAPAGRKLCILRHDVDVDPGAALELARIEAERSVFGTYFVMTRSPVYNAFGRANQTVFRKILELGHCIGLHYDIAFEPAGGSLESWIEGEADILGRMLGTEIRSVSFHQPALGRTRPRTIRLDGLINAFDFPGFTYVSDANKGLPKGSLVRLFREGSTPRIHLCVHPLWWATDDPDATVQELWDRAILGNLRRSQEQLLSTERGFGPPRTWSVTTEQ